MRLNLRELEVFRAVMELGSVTAAAAALGMSQPAATKMLRQAEARLGFRLFRRERNQLRPTAEAHALLPDLLGAFAAIDGVERLARALRGGRTGQISIVAVPVLATALLATAIQAFRVSRPDVLVRVRALTALDAVNEVAEQRADLAVILGTTADPRVEARLLCMSEIGCVLPTGHVLARRRRLSLDDLIGNPLICLSRQQPVGERVRAAQVEGDVAASIAIEVSQSSIACALVRAGAGVAILDGFGLAEAAAQGLVARPLTPRMPLEVTIVAARTRLPSRLSVAFEQHLEEASTRIPVVVSGCP
jgi:DNA-binding transcriptional LysR family regulator